MLRVILILFLVMNSGYVATAYAADRADVNFREKLSESIDKTEKSIKILRQQIVESQNAPFLPDLYVQLGDLLSQKALALYYVQMEHDANLDTGKQSKDESRPVVQATKEAIGVYKSVLQYFPKYAKRSEVTYKIALSLKSIDEIPQFIAVASKLIQDYPGTRDAMRASLLLGKHFLDNQEYDEAYGLLNPIAQSSFNYEKNLARYWIGLVYLGKQKFADALHQFEAVVSDKDLKVQDNPYDLKKASGQGKTDLKREALIDSIRAYTYVYNKNPDPIGYYSKLCPTEAYFQEVMEKLALRYVLLKKYDQSIRLLRATSERVADPQKIINVYREVLLMIPLAQRITIPVKEMRFVLSKFREWRSYFHVPPKTISDSYWYFERQIRDLGTRSHDLAKVEKDPVKKKQYLEYARDYYLLYLDYFGNTRNAVKLATDLADVYYLLGDYYESGDYYLRIFQGKFGRAGKRKALIQNAILALQKDKSDDLYDKTRAKGLLIKAVKSYQAMSPVLRRDPRLELLKLKTEYDQGYLPETLDRLYAFMRTHKTAPQVMDAGDLILDYFNTRNDFQGLELWASKLSFLRIPNAAFNAKLAKIKVQAKEKVVQEKVKSIAGFDEFSQGKSYLQAALQSDNAELKNAAIQEALAKSKREHDIQTFLEAARIMASKEPNAHKRASILRSVAQQEMNVGRFYAGLSELRHAARGNGLDQATRAGLIEDAVNTALMLHDLPALNDLTRDPEFQKVSEPTRNRAREQVSDALDSPVATGDADAGMLFRMGLTDDALESLFKAQYKLGGGMRSRVLAEVRARCGANNRQSFCLWSSFEQLEREWYGTLMMLRRAPTDLKSLEGIASRFMGTIGKYQALEASANPHLETAISIRGKELYQEFSAYLVRVGNANPALRNDLIQKARESDASGAVYTQKCQALVQKSPAVNPAMRFCRSQKMPSFSELVRWNPQWAERAPRSDPSSDEIINLQKSVFSATKDPDPMLKLAALYYQRRDYHHSAALAGYGVNLFKGNEGDFKAILGCSVLKLGYVAEAAYHLKNASDYQGLKTQCSRQLWGMRTQ